LSVCPLQNVVMAIEYVNVDGRYGPIVVCDHCASRIRSGDGNVFYAPGGGTAFEGPHYVHKSCSRAFESSTRPADGAMWLTAELSHWLVYLVENTGYDIEKAKRDADVMSAFE
jgi:hypothetical protein